MTRFARAAILVGSAQMRASTTSSSAVRRPHINSSGSLDRCLLDGRLLDGALPTIARIRPARLRRAAYPALSSGASRGPSDHRRAAPMAASKHGNISARDGVKTELRMLTSAVRSSRGCAASPSYSRRHVQPMLSALRIRRPSKIAPSMSYDRPRACDDRDPQDHDLNLRHPPPWAGV
jgi:hypothetical protein